eukprot:TRINITY_DN8809_c0_g1_i1.p2 TRINITY_DN8809_c0_g1~~TRINITY_DN8809_c0_g1_i1.p2  ORF type:complete len:377 (+),score=94.48 TRINITY_DN8809_c0_g1_i1:150-1280(+)
MAFRGSIYRCRQWSAWRSGAFCLDRRVFRASVYRLYSNQRDGDHEMDMEKLEKLQMEANANLENFKDLDYELDQDYESDPMTAELDISTLFGKSLDEVEVENEADERHDSLSEDILLPAVMEQVSKMSPSERLELEKSLSDDDAFDSASEHAGQSVPGLDRFNDGLFRDAEFTPELIQAMLQRKEQTGFEMDDHQGFTLDGDESPLFGDAEEDADTDSSSKEGSAAKPSAKTTASAQPAVEFSLGGMPEARIKAREEWYRSIHHKRLSSKLYRALTEIVYEERLVEGLATSSVQFEEPMVSQSRSKCIFRWYCSDDADVGHVDRMLSSNASRIKQRLVRRLNLKRFPKVRFERSKAVEMQKEMDALFAEVKQRENW